MIKQNACTDTTSYEDNSTVRLSKKKKVNERTTEEKNTYTQNLNNNKGAY